MNNINTSKAQTSISCKLPHHSKGHDASEVLRCQADEGWNLAGQGAGERILHLPRHFPSPLNHHQPVHLQVHLQHSLVARCLHSAGQETEKMSVSGGFRSRRRAGNGKERRGGRREEEGKQMRKRKNKTVKT